MYIAVKGGAAAIAASWQLLDAARRGDPALRELEVAQIREQLGLLVDRVMAEGSLYDPELAALALKQARGDAIEAAFLIRAYRTTLARFGFTQALDTDRMRVQRRVSAIFKDLPGGQLLGPTFDYTQRLLDFDLLDTQREPAQAAAPAAPAADTPPEVESALYRLVEEGLVEAAAPSPGDPEPPDITRQPPAYPMPRTARLQMLARADEGWLLGLGYSSQRGYANTHPFVGELRFGAVPVEVVPDELGFAIEIGEIELTDCQMVNQFVGSAVAPPQFTRGHGIAFGHGERRAMAMSLVDRLLRADEFDESLESAAQQQEFALPHGDNVEASGFVQHLKLPHYVTFESELQMVRSLRPTGETSA
ncbi:carbon-phosphorus lyase complex subunit PhnI [Aquabacterium sp. A7-Y]|uniref:carbon-phosphorus lyase complex subunit PhnI n=1 Tax=Aquabacterium sp. A7-Y TaxID=1349605 RepID=UPI00223E874C|nr:carbon-phosphorus lyase complex subunit PhnI [Aquabacterium sp. A7-Y]MCW7541333.1 carbon-phosphorus lyase complex subunit PhnI [Aquabacterium sp. A7-Y]